MNNSSIDHIDDYSSQHLAEVFGARTVRLIAMNTDVRTAARMACSFGARALAERAEAEKPEATDGLWDTAVLLARKAAANVLPFARTGGQS